METVEVTFDLERSKKIYKKYFKFERAHAFKNVPIVVTIVFSLVLILIGVFTQNDLWIFAGLATFGAMAVYVCYYLLQFQVTVNNYMSALDKYMSTLEKSDIAAEKNFQFSFDSERIIRESPNSTAKLNWSIIRSYQENEGDLYLYLLSGDLYDIISESIIGEEPFERFKRILKEKVPRRG